MLLNFSLETQMRSRSLLVSGVSGSRITISLISLYSVPVNDDRGFKITSSYIGSTSALSTGLNSGAITVGGE